MADLDALEKELYSLLYASDEAPITTKKELEVSESEGAVDGASVGLGPAQVHVGGGERQAKKALLATTEETKRSKVEFLHRAIIRFTGLFEDIAQLGGDAAFLILDDLYHIKREDQAAVLDYFHRIAKNTGVWIKVGSIRHRTDHYHHGDPSLGMKLGDDADEIDLDLTLEKYDLAKSFLLKVLKGLLDIVGLASEEDILSTTAIDRLVLASGGVARDFLTILRRSIEYGRERGNDARGPRIAAEDVNRAAGEHDTSKRDELRRDSADDSRILEEAFAHIRDHCLDEANANCFLVERDQLPDVRYMVDELVDLKMLHLVNSRVTIPDRPGKLFFAYMLDLSQYAGDRKRRNLEMVPFWEETARDHLRRVGLIFDLGRLCRAGPGSTPGVIA